MKTYLKNWKVVIIGNMVCKISSLVLRLFSYFPGDICGKQLACQCRRQKTHEFDPWVGKTPWKRTWQPTPVLLPGKSHEQRSLVGNSSQGCTELNTTEATWHALIHLLPQTRVQTHVSSITGRFFTTEPLGKPKTINSMVVDIRQIYELQKIKFCSKLVSKLPEVFKNWMLNRT